jgi:hypothetical protein
MESVFVGLGSSSEKFYNSGTDYTFTGGATTPTFARISTGDIDAGDILDVEFQYTPKCSRNNPAAGITNKVDVFVDGSSPFSVSEATIVSSTLLSTSSTSPYFTGNFERVGAPSGLPTVGNKFTRLNSCPIISFPSSLTIGASVFNRNTHYWILRDTTKRRGSPYEISGIEWASSGPAAGQEIMLNYVYNQTPEVLTAVMASSRQICTDVMVHQADYLYITPCLSVQYARSYDISTINTAINNRLQLFFQNLEFGSWVDLSGICLAVQQVVGINSVSITKSKASDPIDGGDDYGVRVYKNSNDTVFETKESNFDLGDQQLAQFMSAIITRKPTP